MNTLLEIIWKLVIPLIGFLISLGIVCSTSSRWIRRANIGMSFIWGYILYLDLSGAT